MAPGWGVVLRLWHVDVWARGHCPPPRSRRLPPGFLMELRVMLCVGAYSPLRSQPAGSDTNHLTKKSHVVCRSHRSKIIISQLPVTSNVLSATRFCQLPRAQRALEGHSSW